MASLAQTLQSKLAYDRADLPADLGAGLTTAIMLIPQAMAYAMLAGLPPIHGLYAATVPLLAYALVGTSRQLAVGPVAMDSLLVAVGVSAIAETGTPSYVAYAVLLALMVGLLQLAMGFARLGVVVDFLSRPVIAGFSSAAALIIASSQLPHLLGIELGAHPLVFGLWAELVSRIGETSLLTLGIAGAALLTLVVLRRVAPKLPRALVVVVAGTLAVWGLSLHAEGVAIVGEVPRGLPAFALPTLELEAIGKLWPTALAIAFVAFMEGISVAKSVAERYGETGPDGRKPRVDANRELIGLGAANALGSLFGGYPVAGGFSRTAVNAEAGARTKLAGVVSAAVVVLTLLLLTPLFYYLPKAVLAAIIVSAVLGLVQLEFARRLWTLERTELALMLLTFAATLGMGIVQGIALGVFASLLLLALRQARPHTAVLGRLPDTTTYRNLDRYPEAETTPGVIALRVDAELNFTNVSYVEGLIEGLIAAARRSDHPARVVVLDASAMNRLDTSAEAALRELCEALARQGVELHLAAVRGPVRDLMARSGFAALLGEQRMWTTVHEAVRAGEAGCARAELRTRPPPKTVTPTIARGPTRPEIRRSAR